jgi:hypothetical protein
MKGVEGWSPESREINHLFGQEGKMILRQPFADVRWKLHSLAGPNGMQRVTQLTE